MPFLVIAFVVVPIVEIAVITQVSDGLGWGWTLTLLFVDSVIGAVLVRREGRRAWTAFREAIATGRWPGDEVAQGALVLVGGALLLTPGFVTDALGLAFVLPPTRAVFSRVLRSRLTPAPVKVFGSVLGDRAGASRGAGGQTAGAAGSPPGARPGGAAGRGATGPDPHTVDIEVVSVEREDPPAPPSGHPDELDRPGDR